MQPATKSTPARASTEPRLPLASEAGWADRKPIRRSHSDLHPTATPFRGPLRLGGGVERLEFGAGVVRHGWEGKRPRQGTPAPNWKLFDPLVAGQPKVTCPMSWDPLSVNQRLPSGPAVIAVGWLPGDGIAYSVTAP